MGGDGRSFNQVRGANDHPVAPSLWDPIISVNEAKVPMDSSGLGRSCSNAIITYSAKETRFCPMDSEILAYSTIWQNFITCHGILRPYRDHARVGKIGKEKDQQDPRGSG